jgi:predicted KAP-like P-loop ATPase
VRNELAPLSDSLLATANEAKNHQGQNFLKNEECTLCILDQWRGWAAPEEPQQWVAGLVESTDGFLALLMAAFERHTTQGLKDYVSQISWRMRLQYLEDFVSLNVLTRRIEQLPLEDLSEEQRRAVDAFQRALSRRKLGRSDDNWLDDDGE